MTDAPQPERALWLGVLVQAIDDYHGRAPDTSWRERMRAREDAAEFLFSPSREVDLEAIATAADVDVDALRAAARREAARRMRLVGRRRT